MGNDIRNLLDVISNDLSPSSTNTYQAIIAGAFLLYFGIMFMFIVILRKREEDIKKEIQSNSKYSVEMGQQI
jgi:hypothetical protein